jgi:hypothetical protein
LVTTILLAFPTGVLAEALRNGNREDIGTAVALYSSSACLMSLSWVPVFKYFKNHPELLEETSSWLYFKNQWIRPWIGVVFYAVAAIVGKYIPLTGMLIFLFMVVYHAYTSEGIGGHRPMQKEE